MEIGPSPRRLIVSTMGSLSSRERKAFNLLGCHNKLSSQLCASEVVESEQSSIRVPPKSFHPRANVYLPVLRPFPVRSFSFYSAQRCPRDTRSMSSTRKSSLAKITCRTHSASWTDVHDNSCFNEIVLIDMPSGTTCPAVVAAT